MCIKLMGSEKVSNLIFEKNLQEKVTPGNFKHSQLELVVAFALGRKFILITVLSTFLVDSNRFSFIVRTIWNEEVYIKNHCGITFIHQWSM